MGNIWEIYGKYMGMSENVGLIFPMIASHLVGIMISKTIGYNGVHNIFRQTQIQSTGCQIPSCQIFITWIVTDVKSPVTKCLFQSVNQRKIRAFAGTGGTVLVALLPAEFRDLRPCRRHGMAWHGKHGKLTPPGGHRPVAPVLWFQRYTCLR